MLKGKNKIIMVVLSLGIGMSILSGCGKINPEKKEIPQNVSMVLGVHEFFPAISLKTSAAYSKIYDACYSWGSVSSVVVDGKPYVGGNFEVNSPGKRVDAAKKKQLASKNAAQIIAETTVLKAQTPEIDTLAAITLSADALHSVGEKSDKSMLVFDSGLSTTNLLNFAEKNIFEEPVDSIISQLRKKHAIPNLKDIDIVWIGLGQTCGKQTALTPDYKFKLQTIWEEILKAGGASSVKFDTTPLAAEEPTMELPECTTVPIVADSLEISEVITKKEIPEVIKWDGNSSIKYQANKAEFVDEMAAMKELEPVAEYLNANPENTIGIFGMTATVANGTGIELSNARAEACKELLKRQGVRESQILTVGLGQIQNSLRTNDIDENGCQIEAQAQKNRAVFVVRGDSELINVLLECVSERR